MFLTGLLKSERGRGYPDIWTSWYRRVTPMTDASREQLVKVPIALPRDQYEWLREFAFTQRIPMAEVVRQALRAHRAHFDPTPRRAGR